MESVGWIYDLWNGVDAEALRIEDAEWFSVLVDGCLCTRTSIRSLANNPVWSYLANKRFIDQ